MPNQIFIRRINVARDVMILAILVEKLVMLNGSVSSFMLTIIVVPSVILGFLLKVK